MNQQIDQREIATGILSDHSFISPKYFYDSLGSKLFEAICLLPEYYPTRTEATIFERNQNAIAKAIRPGSTLIDLGAGNCAKAATLFPIIHPNQYVPIDISVDHLNNAVQQLQQRFPQIEMHALGRDFSLPWSMPAEVRFAQRLFFYPGSSIGNFTPDAALNFLKQLREFTDKDGGILIGVDLIKDQTVLNAAYNDSLGITSAFNANILNHVNRIIGANFDVQKWRHVAFFNEEKSRIEMHLEALSDLNVSWGNHQRDYKQGECIHTENSYKYSLPNFFKLLEAAHFGQATYWTDENNWYAVIYAKAI